MCIQMATVNGRCVGTSWHDLVSPDYAQMDLAKSLGVV